MKYFLEMFLADERMMHIHLTLPTDPPSYPDDSMPMQSEAGCQLEFDNHDDTFNPFQGSDKMAPSPARPAAENVPDDQALHTEPDSTVDEPAKTEYVLDETLPITPSVENSLFDVSANVSSAESSVVTVAKVAAVEEQDSRAAAPDERPVTSQSADENQASGSFVEDAPLPVKSSYNLNFDDLDAMNPFQTGGSKIPNSPTLGRKMSDNSLFVDEPQIKEQPPADIVDVPEASVQLEVPPAATYTDKSAPNTEGSIKLEFNFDNGGEVKPKPMPKKFGKRLFGAKSEVKPAHDKPPSQESQVKPDAGDASGLSLPKSSYSFDFDKLDDLDLDPFGTKTSVSNSPKTNKDGSLVPEQTDKPAQEGISWCVKRFDVVVLSVYLR